MAGNAKNLLSRGDEVVARLHHSENSEIVELMGTIFQHLGSCWYRVDFSKNTNKIKHKFNLMDLPANCLKTTKKI